jgi:KaiC/GvpD/RAD55 family RecA-like ATPase
MPRITRLTAVVLAVLAAACSDSSSPLDPELDELEPGGAPVEVTRLHARPAFYTGFSEPARLVVDDQVELEQVWARLGTRPENPVVDFGRELVLVAAMGGRPTGGYSVRVEEVRAYADHVTVHVVETSPGRSCVTTQALTAPAEAVKIPRTSLEVRFRTTQSVHECR